MRLFIVFVSGVLFAVGLGLAGMTDANNVIDFLDIGGDWNPRLAFVMAGAIGIHFWVRKHAISARTPGFKMKIDRRLIGGSLLFGIGWGLAGYCPGPVIAAMPSAATEVLAFLACMMAGMFVFEAWQRRASLLAE